MLGRYNAQGLGAGVEAVTKQIVVDKGESDLVKLSFFLCEGIFVSMSDGLIGDNKQQWVSTTNCAPSEVTDESGSSSGSPSMEFWLRVTPGVEYIKLAVRDGRVVGALLIGDTELEEVFENLILNRLDVSALGVGLLDPEVDIADYFD
jgi:hypothetical protein